jgi:circadian clock protein KaiC
MRIVKYRGTKFRGGYHDYTIRTGGIDVYPRLVAAEHRSSVTHTKLPSGNPRWTDCWRRHRGGHQHTRRRRGRHRKSTLAMQFATAAAERGSGTAVFLFDENPQTLVTRCTALGNELSLLRSAPDKSHCNRSILPSSRPGS